MTILQCYAPTKTSDIVGKDIFYGQLHAVQGKLPKVNIVIVIGDLNAKMASNNILLGHMMRKDGVDGGIFVDFCNFHFVVIGGTLFKRRAYHKVA